MSFDVLADDRIANEKKDNWLFQATMSRRHAHNQKTLTDQRTTFITEHVLGNQNQGPAKSLSCRQRETPPVFFTARRKVDEALAIFPRYSARLLLSIRLLTPLLTKDDDPFYLFDNPVRKDHILGLPYLSAAALKGLAADAYQRAFPGDVNWREAGQQAGVHQFRRDDHNQNDLPQSALRLFGIADDSANNSPSQIGRLHFSPLWFDTVQFLVMNPGSAEKAIGTLPIQFEAIAPDPPDKPNQTHEIEVIYCNPYGAKDTGEIHARADLARFLAALAVWWPALGIGAKRLAGYGAIEIVKAELQAVGWSGVTDNAASEEASNPGIPEYVREFQDEAGALIPESELDSRLVPAGEAGEQLKALDQEKKRLQTRKWELQQNRQQAGVDRKLNQVKTNIKQINKQLEVLRKPFQQELQAIKARYQNARKWLVANMPTLSPTEGEMPAAPAAPALVERSETGPDSWLNLAQWIAGETA